jgi:hypothetical protein
MKPFTIIGSVVALFGAVVALHAQTRPLRSSAGNLLQIGQAVLMYANDNKGYFPPDLGKVTKYVKGDLDLFVSPRRATEIPSEVRAKPEDSALWFTMRCDYVLTVPPGTRLTRVRDMAQFPLVVEKGSEPDAPIAILYADGHVVEYGPQMPRGGPAFRANPSAPASRPAALIPAPPSTQPATAGALVGKLPGNVASALAGSWRISFERVVQATYTFNPDGTFALAFAAVPPHSPPGRASGTWKLDGTRLVITNTASDTPYTVIGEQETAEVVGLTDDALALHTTNRKGTEEVMTFQRVIPFAKGKHDNPKVMGTWQADRALLVLAESGLAVMNAGGQSVKGEWSQRGGQLLILFDTPPPSDNRRRADPDARSREVSLTIDLVNDTTLVLTGPLLHSRDNAPATFLRVK